jgi:hypothetical protein
MYSRGPPHARFPTGAVRHWPLAAHSPAFASARASRSSRAIRAVSDSAALFDGPAGSAAGGAAGSPPSPGADVHAAITSAAQIDEIVSFRTVILPGSEGVAHPRFGAESNLSRGIRL